MRKNKMKTIERIVEILERRRYNVYRENKFRRNEMRKKRS
jgi:hypothetical protein